MTQSNVRGGYMRTLEVNREGVNTSITTLDNELLKKANSYVCQVSRFISNTTPVLNLIPDTTVYIEVLQRGDAQHLHLGQVVNLDVSVRQFKPQPYRTWLELGRQLHFFCKKICDHSQIDGGLTFSILDSGIVTFGFSAEFATEYYLKFAPEFVNFTGFPGEYLYLIADEDGDEVIFDGDYNDLFSDQDNLTFEDGYFYEVREPRTFESALPLSSFDHRLSLDCIATFPISTTITCFNSVESRDFLLARFPIADYIEMYNTIENTNWVERNRIVQETVNLGLEDLCRKNPNTISTFLLPGELRHCNFTLQTRYLNDGTITKIDSDFTNGGFWSMQLLFSKKLN